MEADWHIYRSTNRAIIGSNIGLSPIRCQAIIWTNTGLLLIEVVGTYFIEIWIKIQQFSLKKINFNLPFAIWRPLCLDINMLKRIYEAGNVRLTCSTWELYVCLTFRHYCKKPWEKHVAVQIHCKDIPHLHTRLLLFDVKKSPWRMNGSVFDSLKNEWVSVWFAVSPIQSHMSLMLNKKLNKLINMIKKIMFENVSSYYQVSMSW